MKYHLLLFIVTACALSVWPLAATCLAHDVWLQTNTNLVRTKDVLHIDLLLGNHGNGHRDFKMAGKADIGGATVDVIAPGGQRLDVTPTLNDIGYAPQEGFWTARFVPSDPGLYMVSHVSDKVMSYGPVRSVKGAKTFFLASPTLDKITVASDGFERAVGHPLELVPLASPVLPMGPGTPIRVRLLYKGKPQAGSRVSFIPRGQPLAEGTDATYERTTDDKGEASFTPTVGTYYLVAAHQEEPKERGDGYERTKYSATLCVYVPQTCACCNE